jgi:acetolactate synthase-like protein
MHVSRQFGGAWEPQDITPIPVTPPRPKEEQIDEVAKILLEAKRPLILLGSQATLPPVKADDLRTTVEVISKLRL